MRSDKDVYPAIKKCNIPSCMNYNGVSPLVCCNRNFCSLKAQCGFNQQWHTVIEQQIIMERRR
jgi:hypothetical protein